MKGYSTGPKGHGNIKEIIFYITPNTLHQFQIWIQSVCIMSLCDQNFVAKQWHLTHFLIHLKYSPVNSTFTICLITELNNTHHTEKHHCHNPRKKAKSVTRYR